MAGNARHTGATIALGAALGAVAGVIAGHIGVWLAIGVATGIAIGASFRRKQPSCPRCAQIHRMHENYHEASRRMARDS